MHNEIINAAQNGDNEKIKNLIDDNDIDINECRNEITGDTALHRASYFGNTSTVELLIEKGADVNSINHEVYGFTPLYYASSKGHNSVVDLLLEKGAKINTIDIMYKRSALDMAWIKGHTSTVELLIEKGADTNSLKKLKQINEKNSSNSDNLKDSKEETNSLKDATNDTNIEEVSHPNFINENKNLESDNEEKIYDITELDVTDKSQSISNVYEFKGHLGWVTTVNITYNDQFIVSGGGDDSIRIWSVESGRCLHIFQGHYQIINSIAISHDDKNIVSGSDDKTIRIWNIESGKCEHILEGHQNGVKSIVISHDDKYIISGSNDNTIRIWNTATWECEHVLEGHQDCIWTVSISHDDKYIISGSNDNTIRIWNTATWECEHVLEGHQDFVLTLIFSHDDKYIISTSGDKSIRIWNTSSGKCKHILEGHQDRVKSITISHDDKYIISGCHDKTIRIWNTSSGKCEHILEGHQTAIDSVVISNNDQYIISGSQDCNIRIWNVYTGKCEHVLKGHQGGINSLTISHNDRFIVSGAWDSTIRLWNSPFGNVLRHYNAINSIAISHNNKYIITGSQDKTIGIWNATSCKCENILKGHRGYITAVSITFNYQYIVSSGSYDKTIRIWNIESGKCEHVLEGHQLDTLTLVISHDDKNIVSGSDDKTIRIWNIESGKCEHILEGHQNGVKSIVISHDDKYIISGSGDNTIRIWNMGSFKCEKILEGHQNGVNSIVISHDDKYIISGSSDKTIRIWNSSSGKCEHVLEGHQDCIRAVTISNNDRYIISGSQDKTIRIWNSSSGKCEHVLEGHQDCIRAVTISNNDRYIISGSQDKTIRIWSFPSFFIYRQLFWYSTEYSPLFFLYLQNHPSYLIFGIDHFYSIEIFGDCYTILHWICKTGKTDFLKEISKYENLFKILLDNGFSDLDKDNKTPFDLAVENNHSSCILHLLSLLPKCPLAKRDGFVKQIPSLIDNYPKEVEKVLVVIGDRETIPEQDTIQQGVVRVKNMSIEDSILNASEGLIVENFWKNNIPDQYIDNYGNSLEVTSSILGIPGLSQQEFGSEAIKKILQDNMSDILSTPVFKHMIDFKWKAFASFYFKIDFAIYILFMVLFCVSSIIPFPYCYSMDYVNSSTVISHIILDLIICLCVFRFIYFEIRQCLLNPKGYFTDAWNYIDIFANISFICLIPLRIICTPYQGIVLSLAALFYWFKLFHYIRVFESIGLFVRIIFKIARGILLFMFILIIWILAFSHAFFLLFSFLASDDTDTDFNSYVVIFKFYQMTLSGDFLDDISSLESWLYGVSLSFAIIFSLFVSLLMLNLLIALMSTIYEDVQQNAKQEALMERAGMIMNIEEYWLSNSSNIHYFPKWIHCLHSKTIPTDDDDPLDAIKEQILEISSTLKNFAIQNGINNEIKKLSDRIEENQNMIKSLLK